MQNAFDDLSDALSLPSGDIDRPQRIQDAIRAFPRSEGVRTGVKGMIESEGMSGVFADFLRDDITARKLDKNRGRAEFAPDTNVVIKTGHEALVVSGIKSPEVNVIDKYDYLRELLPVVTRPEDVKSDIDPYAHFFVKDDQESQRMRETLVAEEARMKNTPEGKNRAYYDKFVTTENKQSSLDTMQQVVKSNPELVKILHEASLDPSDMTTVDAIREDPDVRFSVARYFAEKLDRLADSDPEGFGQRVAENSRGNFKVDAQTGKRMLSRDYAVSLALKMLDGEFSGKLEADDFARNNEGRVILGQHRDAARMALMSRY